MIITAPRPAITAGSGPRDRPRRRTNQRSPPRATGRPSGPRYHSSQCSGERLRSGQVGEDVDPLRRHRRDARRRPGAPSRPRRRSPSPPPRPRASAPCSQRVGAQLGRGSSAGRPAAGAGPEQRGEEPAGHRGGGRRPAASPATGSSQRVVVVAAGQGGGVPEPDRRGDRQAQARRAPAPRRVDRRSASANRAVRARASSTGAR